MHETKIVFSWVFQIFCAPTFTVSSFQGIPTPGAWWDLLFLEMGIPQALREKTLGT